jgi:protein-S-isoprenylcysteine O-methyltransferase Ste14
LFQETIFRLLILLSGVAMLAIRSCYQSGVLRDRARTTVVGSRWRLIPGGIAALTTTVFGLAYVFFPSAFPWSYADWPDWLRWGGVAMLVAGILLLWSAHHYLGASFHSFVVRKSGQRFVEAGPYRFVRHPIYTAYTLSYLGAGLLACSLVLTFVATPLYLLLVALRIGEEESAMVAEFGEEYADYMGRTGRFLPSLGSLIPSQRE